MEEKRRKKRGFVKMLLILLLVAAAILAVTLAVGSQREGGLKALFKRLSGRESVTEFFYENAFDGAFTELEGGIAVASNSGLFVYDSAGALAWSRLFSWTSPAITGSGEYRAAFDVGGNLVILFEAGKSIAEITTEQPVVSAIVNELGYLTVCTEADGYYGIVTVYNSLGKAIYRWSAGSARILSARVSGRSNLAVLTVGSAGCRIVAMTLDSVELKGEYTYPGLLIDMVFTEDGLIAIGTDCMVGLGKTLNERWRYDFDGKYLRGYAIDNSGAALALSYFQVGDEGTVVTVSADGGELGSLVYDNGIGPIAVRGGRVALFQDERIGMYDMSLNLIDRFECDPGIQRLMFREDGTLLGAGTFSAYVYGTKE